MKVKTTVFVFMSPVVLGFLWIVGALLADRPFSEILVVWFLIVFISYGNLYYGRDAIKKWLGLEELEEENE